MEASGAESLSARLVRRAHQAIAEAGGWLPFDRFMSLALYEPGLGYYARGARLFGTLPGGGSDFITAPELSPLFGATLARQVAQVFDAGVAAEIVEFGAGSGALAEQLLDALGERVACYRIVELAGALGARQQQRLARFGSRVQWLDAWPEHIDGVVLGNEVLDAMPVQLLHWDGLQWSERGVVSQGDGFGWSERASALRPPGVHEFAPGAVIEIHLQAEAFVRTLAERLARGVAFFIDYGFPEAEYYHPQRHQGTLMCHCAHIAEAGPDAPLVGLGEKDITAHVNFSAIALAAQEAGFEVIGYTSQARFLFNCGILDRLQGADTRTVAGAQKLFTEHEMGELFKVIGLARGVVLAPLGFAAGDRTHTL